MENEILSANIQEVAAPENTQPDAEPENTPEKEAHESQGEEGAEVADPQKKERDFEKDAAFSRIRREAEEAKRAADAEKRNVEKLRRQLNKFDFKGDSIDELIVEAEHFRTKKPHEVIRAEIEAQERLTKIEDENRALKESLAERTFKEDLATINETFPDAKLRDVKELGADFIRLRASGVSTLAAYNAVKGALSATQKPKPPSPGPAKDKGGAVPKEFFTKDEVKRMSDAEIEKNLDKIKASQQKWPIR